MRIMHIALGGCIAPGAIEYGLTEDTGGHIAYVLGATHAQARRSNVSHIDIVTRRFTGPGRRTDFSAPEDTVDAKRRIIRLSGARDSYLEKTDLEAELPSLTDALLQHLAQSPRPHVIHAHFADAAQMALAAKEAFGIPFLYSSHSLGLQTADVSPDRIARERLAIHKADAIIASSRDEAEFQLGAYEAVSSGRIHRVSPGVDVDLNADPDAAHPLIDPFLRDPNKPIILAVARPVAKKNLAGLLTAYAQHRDLQNAANLVILAGQRGGIGGDHVQTDVLFDLVDRHDLWGKVALPRHHTAADVQGLYALAAQRGVFVNPALHEPFGLTVVEALQHGVPVVATRYGGPAEVLTDAGFGALVDPDDSDQISAACYRLLHSPRTFIGRQDAKHKARATYCWDNWAASVDAIIHGIARPEPRKKPVSRLLISDIDGTLTGCPDGVEAFKTLLRGQPTLAFAVATGRSVSEARRILTKWKLPEPNWIISSVGSEVWCRAAGGAYLLDPSFAQAIEQGWDRDAVWDIAQSSQARLQPRYDQRCWKISAFGSADVAADIQRRLSAAGIPANVVASHGSMIDILPARAGKAAAAAHLARHLEVPREACIAAGDSGNDRDLLEWAGLSLLPSNALSELADVNGPTVMRQRRAHAGGVVGGLNAALDAQPLLAAE